MARHYRYYARARLRETRFSQCAALLQHLANIEWWQLLLLGRLLPSLFAREFTHASMMHEGLAGVTMSTGQWQRGPVLRFQTRHLCRITSDSWMTAMQPKARLLASGANVGAALQTSLDQLSDVRFGVLIPHVGKTAMSS